MKKHILFFLYILSGYFLHGQQTIDTSLFQYERKIDNQHIKDEYNVTYDFINSVYAIDINEYDNSYYYASIIDDGYNVGFYLDDTGHADCYAYNSSNEERFLDFAGKVALTKSGRIYVVDNISNEIYFWNKNSLGFEPEGKIDFEFSYIQDICCGEDDCLYILDINEKKIYKYSTAIDTFINFPDTKFCYTSYYNKSSSTWGYASGMAVSDGYIYMIFNHAAIIKLDETGNLIDYFVIDSTSLGLSSYSTKFASDTWLENINIGPYKNIYVLDTANQKIHIFNPELEYICSWHDPEHPVGTDATDLCFAPGSYSMYISHTWGAYEFVLRPGLCGFSTQDSFLYPDCVNENYKGLAIDISFLGEGNAKINITGNDIAITLLNKYSSFSNKASHFRSYWDGKDNDGNIVPYGAYEIEFIFNDSLISSVSVDVLNFQGVEILNDEYTEISNSETIDYNYRIIENGFLTISIVKPGDFNDIEWENVVNKIKIIQGDYTETITDTDLPDGYYCVAFKIVPPALILRNAKPVTSAAYFSINDNDLELSDITLLSGGFSPHSVTANKIKSQFNLSETSMISAYIYDEKNNHIITLIDNVIFSDGTNEIEWDGYNSQNQMVPDGNYCFMVQAASIGMPGSPAQKQSSYFILDASPVEIEITGEQSIYYISPDEPSSIGVQDSLDLTINFNKDVNVSARIVDKKEREINAIISGLNVTCGNELQLQWDGMDYEYNYAEDGRYAIIIEAIDIYGSFGECKIPVIVDNNKSVDEINNEGITGYNEYQVDDDTDTFIEDLKTVKIDGGHVIAWNDLDNEIHNVIIYNDSGVPKSKQISIIPDSYGFSREYFISKTPDGFVIIWLETDVNFNFDILKAQQFDDSGKEIGEKLELIRIADSSYKVKGIACTETDDGYALLWTHQDGNTLFVQFFDKYFKAINNPHIITENTTGFVSAETTGSGIMALWQSEQENNPGYYKTYVKKIEQDDPLSENLIEIYTGDKIKSKLIKSNAGFIVVGPFTGSYITAVQLDNDGHKTGKEIIINDQFYNHSYDESGPDAIKIDDGFIVAWYTLNWRIAARRIDESFAPVGREIILNTSTMDTYNPVLCPSADGFIAAWLLSKKPDPDGNRYFRAVFSRQFDVSHPVTGGNLYAEIQYPLHDSLPTDEILYIRGIIDDANIDRFTLSLIDQDNIGKYLITQFDRNIDGNIYCLDTCYLVKGHRHTLRLEAWDKAGNYKNHMVDFYPQQSSNHYLLSYDIPDPFCSKTKHLYVNFSLLQPAFVEFTMINCRNEIVDTVDLGLLPVDDNEASFYTADLEEGAYQLLITLKASDDTWVQERINDFTIDNSIPEIFLNDFTAILSNQNNVDIQLNIHEQNLEMMSIELIDSDYNTIKKDESENIIELFSFNPSVLSEGRYDLIISAIDKSGNNNQLIENIYIDRTPPQINIMSPNHADILSGEIHIEADIIEETEFHEYNIYYSIDSGEENLLLSGNESYINTEWNSGTVINDTFELELRFLAADSAGNYNEETRNVIVCNRKPKVNIEFNCINYTESMQYFVNNENSIVLSASTESEYSSITNIYFSHSSPYNDMQVYIEPVTLPAGVHEFHYYAEDSLGNISEESIAIINVDTAPPELSHTIIKTHYVAETTTFISSENIIIVYCNESGFPKSGIARLEYKINDDEWISQEELYKNQYLYIQVEDEGFAEITIISEDNVNNQTEKNLGTFYIDNTAPETQMDTNIQLTGGPEIFSAQTGLTCEWSASDSSSGVYETVVTINEEAVSNGDLSYTFTAEGMYTIAYYSTDNAGNIEATNNIVIEIEQAEMVLGDVNGDGAINIIDALKTAQYYVGLDPSNFNPVAADTDCNGTINIVDALIIARYYVGSISVFCD
ncbi:MAG: hypothetical protein JW881_15940 [Spirochaetales bacterium]|nr:hypothetical protein [Spirochaetales bacterium]